MDKRNKYRGDLREQFLGTRNEPKRDKNGHRIPTDVDRPHRERYHYVDSANLLSSHTFTMEPKNNSVEHLNCPSGRCLHSQYDTRGHRAPPDPAPVKLSRNYDYDFQYYRHKNEQNYCAHHSTRKPSHNTRNHHQDTEPGTESPECCEEYLVYKNPAYREATSDQAEEVRHDPVPVNEYDQKHYQLMDSHHKEYEKARAHCLASDERLRQKYSFLSDDSLTSKKSKPSQNTIISAKSGKDLRSIICSQIHLQQVMEQPTTHIECKTPPREDHPPPLEDNKKENEEVSGPEKGTPTTVVKPKTPKGRPQNKEVIEEPELDKLSTIDLSDMFTVSADDIVSSKVIEPMTRKIQRMYLNTLQEEMTILEYLGRVPRLVSQVYRETALRDNRKSSDIK